MLVYHRVFLLANACYTICKGNRTIWIFAWKPQHQELQILYPELIAPVTASRGRSEMWRTSCSASATSCADRWMMANRHRCMVYSLCMSKYQNTPILSNTFGISWLHCPLRLSFLKHRSLMDPYGCYTSMFVAEGRWNPHVVGQGTALAQRWSAESFLCNRTWGVWHGDFAKHQKWWFKHQKWSLNHQKWWFNMI